MKVNRLFDHPFTPFSWGPTKTLEGVMADIVTVKTTKHDFPGSNPSAECPLCTREEKSDVLGI